MRLQQQALDALAAGNEERAQQLERERPKIEGPKQSAAEERLKNDVDRVLGPEIGDKVGSSVLAYKHARMRTHICMHADPRCSQWVL